MVAIENINEIQDRERRKENLIVFGLHESEKKTEVREMLEKQKSSRRYVKIIWD